MDPTDDMNYTQKSKPGAAGKSGHRVRGPALAAFLESARKPDKSALCEQSI
eukprot:gene38442-51941_t